MLAFLPILEAVSELLLRGSLNPFYAFKMKALEFSFVSRKNSHAPGPANTEVSFFFAIKTSQAGPTL